MRGCSHRYKHVILLSLMWFSMYHLVPFCKSFFFHMQLCCGWGQYYRTCSGKSCWHEVYCNKKRVYISSLEHYILLLNKRHTEGVHLFYGKENLTIIQSKLWTLFSNKMYHECSFQLHCTRGLCDSRCRIRLHRRPTRSTLWFGFLRGPAPQTICKLNEGHIHGTPCYKTSIVCKGPQI